ncbi:hypothetical protein AYL99_07761 [Fonsecaea erecta]|uniref:ABM domain-containing protein n=1 Tax=Fonsecaea erecta TaxID=1367422 RepID=A0A178ZGS1_9EURO|nr:hypothetical protein AYL99_07761 [Fonsecaea erecta]OAP58671.1 hypothetical protein AYL99_07761 [Fonsecaea erecta]
MPPARAFIADIYSDAGAGQQAVLEAIRGVDKHVVSDEPWASVYYWYISEDPNDGTVYGLEEYETEKHHLEGHNTSKPFLHLVDTVGKSSSKENKLKLEYLEPVLGFTERSGPTKAGVVRVERITTTSSQMDAVLDQLKPFALHVEQNEPGTQSFFVYKSRESPDQIVIFERFETKAGLEAHLQSEVRKKLDDQLASVIKGKTADCFKEAGIGFMKRH